MVVNTKTRYSVLKYRRKKIIERKKSESTTKQHSVLIWGNGSLCYRRNAFENQTFVAAIPKILLINS